MVHGFDPQIWVDRYDKYVVKEGLLAQWKGRSIRYFRPYIIDITITVLYYIIIFCVTKSTKDCKLLKSDTDSVRKWWIENYTKINIFEKNI